MKLTDKIYFYEGDYTSPTQIIYRGIGSSNFMVVKGEKQVMIDSGTNSGPHKKRIITQTSADGIRLGETSEILLSHTHPDHILMAKKICRRRPVSIMLHEESELMARRSIYQFEAHYNFPDFILREVFDKPIWIARAVVKAFFDFEYLNIQHLLHDFEKVDIGREATIIPLRAHFPGHIGVLFNSEKILYSADLFDFRVSEGGIINNALSSYTGIFTDLERVYRLDLDTIVPGHGRVIKGASMVKVMLDRVYTGTENYIKGILTAIKKSGRGKSLREITASLFDNSNAYNIFSRRVIVYNTLMHMKTEGMADFTIRDGIAFWRG